jgi:hydroxyacylglutathione hydrolase
MTAIITVPAFSDNYIWLICDENKKYAVIVDPGDAAPVIKALEKSNIQPIAILITHFHQDHTGGISALLNHYTGLPVHGPSKEQIPHISKPLSGGEKLHFDQLDATLEVLAVPGHTAGHIAYYDSTHKNLFCGDTLFAAGCGRVFDGTFLQLHDSLQKIAQLPEDTLIYCAHEYTLDNLGFAKWVEPDNQKILAREEADRAAIDADQATVPSLLSLELKTNPFMRTNLKQVQKQIEEATGQKLADSSEVFAAMRSWKDMEYD